MLRLERCIKLFRHTNLERIRFGRTLSCNDFFMLDTFSKDNYDIHFCRNAMQMHLQLNKRSKTDLVVVYSLNKEYTVANYIQVFHRHTARM